MKDFKSFEEIMAASISCCNVKLNSSREEWHEQQLSIYLLKFIRAGLRVSMKDKDSR